MSGNADLWAAVGGIRPSALGVAHKPSGTFTIAEYAARYGIHRRTAGEQLARLAESGQLQTKRIVLCGHLTNIYWIPQPEEKARKRA